MEVQGLAVPPLCTFVDVAIFDWHLRRPQFTKSLKELIIVRRKSIQTNRLF